MVGIQLLDVEHFSPGRAACRDGADVPLPTIFEPFLRGSADLEAEVWGAAAAAPQSYVGELGRRTRDELLL